ncbi:MAG: VOC family protein, partial [Candidatus Eisenbacteria bacterium]
MTRLDHLLFATQDVDATVEDLAKRLGVTAAPGGQHPAWGTRNALLSLGPRRYLEIIGPDGERPPPLEARPAGIDTLRTARLTDWAATSTDLAHDVARARQAGMELGNPQTGSRRRADGSLL